MPISPAQSRRRLTALPVSTRLLFPSHVAFSPKDNSPLFTNETSTKIYAVYDAIPYSTAQGTQLSFNSIMCKRDLLNMERLDVRYALSTLSIRLYP